MEDHLHGRLTTLNKLKSVRDDPNAIKWDRQRADKAMNEIIVQLKDKKLMGMRERLIRATRAGDTREVWKIEQQMHAHEGKDIEIEE